MTVTMRHVAAALGVSVTTVSKVLNNRGDIGDEMRERVLAKVEELGYRPNAVARSLTLRRTHTLGVLVADLMHSFFVEIVASIEEYIHPLGYGLLLCNVGEDPARERPQLQMLLDRQVDGVILASVDAQHGDALLSRVIAAGKGLVLIDRDDHPSLDCHRVLTDDHQVGQLATEHLIALGHRRIAHLQGPSALVHAARREQGYRTAMARHGLPVAPEWVVSCGFKEKDGYDAVVRLSETAPDATAVFVASDFAAIGALSAAFANGWRVPEELSIVGAGGIAHMDMLRVPMTTVSWSRREMGISAARLMIEQIEHSPSGPFSRVIVPPTLIARDSSGPPRTGGQLLAASVSTT
jgi:LacI family transcriptional regulator